MVAANGLLRIFWPSDIPKSQRQGTIVGWRNTNLDVFVVSVLQDVEVITKYQIMHRVLWNVWADDFRLEEFRMLFKLALYTEEASIL